MSRSRGRRKLFMRDFFLVTPIGFEELAQRELEWWLTKLKWTPPKPIQLEKGGVSVTLDLSEGCQLNRFLKIPVRILLREKSFSCRDFSRLSQKLQRIPWRDYVQNGSLHWYVSSHKSRLYNKKKISEVAHQAYNQFCKGSPPKKSGATQDLNVFLRWVDDTCHVSVDTSGDPLYQRGYKSYSVPAPIRENLAAGLLYAMGEVLPGTEWIDPMSGGGTFLTEAALLHKDLKPLRTWTYQSFALAKKWVEPTLESQDLFSSFCGRDQEPNAVQASQSHFQFLVEKQLLAPDVKNQFEVQDVLSTVGKSDLVRRNWVICNPPYGERLSQKQIKNKGYFDMLVQKILLHYQPEKMGFLLPAFNWKGAQYQLEGYAFTKRLFFKNGGIPVEFWVGEKSTG